MGLAIQPICAGFHKMAISGLGPPQSNFATVGASPLRSDDTRPANMLTAPLQPGGSRGSQTLSERLEKSWEPVNEKPALSDCRHDVTAEIPCGEFGAMRRQPQYRLIE